MGDAYNAKVGLSRNFVDMDTDFLIGLKSTIFTDYFDQLLNASIAGTTLVRVISEHIRSPIDYSSRCPDSRRYAQMHSSYS